MKCVMIAFAALVAVAASSSVYSAYSVSPLAYSTPYAGAPYAGYPYGAYPYASAITAYAAAPVAVAAPAIQSGYVAATRGSVHVAPHPEGPFTASHHINTAPAPGTF